MMWILIILAIIVIVFLVKFFNASAEDSNLIKSQGGMRVVYKQFVDEIMKYHTAQTPVEGSFNYLGIEGKFYDPIMKRECGVWSLHMQHTFKMIQVKYKAVIKLNGVPPIDHHWDFPVGIDQKEMARIVKQKMDESNIYGIIK